MPRPHRLLAILSDATMLTDFQMRNLQSETRNLRVIDLGLIDYAECWDFQNKIAAEVESGHALETLLLLEHPHTYTFGRSGGREHVLVSEEELKHHGIATYDVDRGGDITYHGPGQLVAYPIINLRNYGERLNYGGYVRTLERVLIAVLGEIGIASHPLKGFSGVWIDGPTGEEKIAAVGVRVNGRGITTHGISLNVAPDLRFFSYIVPCGISDKGVTTISQTLGSDVPMFIVKDTFARHFADQFGFDLPSSGDA